MHSIDFFLKGDSKKKSCIMLLKICIPNKYCSFEMSIYQKILKQNHGFHKTKKAGILFSILIIIRNVFRVWSRKCDWRLE